MGIFYYFLPARLVILLSVLSVTATAQQSELKKINLGFDSLCSVHVTPEGDVYTLGKTYNNPQILSYTIFKDDLNKVYKGEVVSSDGAVSYCSSQLKIIPGQRDNFFVPIEWMLSPGQVSKKSWLKVHNVNYQQNNSDIIFSKENASLGNLFVDKALTTLYVSSSPATIWSDKPPMTTVSAVDLATKHPLWSKDFLFANRGSIVSPDRSRFYLIGEDKSALISLVDQTIIHEGHSLIDGMAATVDDNGDVYAGKLKNKDDGLFMAKLQPFSSPSDELLWQVPSSAAAELPTMNRSTRGPDGLLYVSSVQGEQGAGITVMDATNGEFKAYIPAPDGDFNRYLADVSPAIFDKDRGDGSSFYSFMQRENANAVDRDDRVHYEIWRFTSHQQPPEKVFTVKTGYYLSRGFSITQNRLFFGVKDSLYIYDLNPGGNESASEGVTLNGPDHYTRAEANQGIPVHVKLPATAEQGKDYYLFSLNENRTKFGSYIKLNTGSEGETTVKIHQSWHPQGGKFTIGLTDDVRWPATVKAIGDTISIMVTP